MQLDDLYQQIILDHNKKRAGYGLNGGGFPSHQYNPTCGDEITLTVRLSDDGETITAFEWEGSGCSISQASASLMTSVATPFEPLSVPPMPSVRAARSASCPASFVSFARMPFP